MYEHVVVSRLVHRHIVCAHELISGDRKQEIIPASDMLNRQFLDLVRRLLTFDPAQRISVREALNHPYFTLQIGNEI